MSNDRRSEPSVTQPVTLQQIASELGVSTATVSLALRGSEAVARATRERVQTRARELGYVYNRSAASLRTARSHMIAVCVHDITNPYFAELLKGVERAAMSEGRMMLLGTYDEDFERQQRLLATFREYRPDGLVLCPAVGTTIEDLRSLTDTGTPIVQLSREIVGSGLDFVGSEDGAGARLATEHLIGLGHRRIAFFGGVDGASTSDNRRRAYRQALAAHGLPVDGALFYSGWGRRETGLLAIDAMLDLAEPPTAAVCFNDVTAFGAMLGLYRRGMTPGRDFALVGYDDTLEASQWFPGLTSLRHTFPPGPVAGETLFSRLRDPGRPQQRRAIAPTLIVRGTSQPPKA